MLDQIGVAFPKGAPLVTELRLLRVVEFHCDFIAGWIANFIGASEYFASYAASRMI
jgi:hypothetical protein